MGPRTGPTKRDLERYRSGHNGADSKSDGRVIPARGFESHPLRQIKRACLQALFIWRCAVCGRTHPGSTKIAERFLDAAAWARWSGAKRRTSGRPRPRAIPPSPPFMQKTSWLETRVFPHISRHPIAEVSAPQILAFAP